MLGRRHRGRVTTCHGIPDPCRLARHTEGMDKPAEPTRDELKARAVNLLRDGASIRAVASALGIGRTAAGNLAAEIEAESAAAPMIDPAQLAAETAADALAEARASAATLERLLAAAEADGDHRAALAILREQRLQRAGRLSAAAALARAAPPAPAAIEAHATESPEL